MKSITLSDNNYKIAYKTLVERYENKRLLANAYYQDIIDAPKLNLEGLWKLSLPIDSSSFVMFQL